MSVVANPAYRTTVVAARTLAAANAVDESDGQEADEIERCDGQQELRRRGRLNEN